MATLFDLHVDNITAGNIIDNAPLLNNLTVAGFAAIEGGNRLMLLYAAGVILLIVTICSIYRLIKIIFIEKQSWHSVRKYLFCIFACRIVYGLTFIPSLEIRSPLYRGDDAVTLASLAWNFVRARYSL